MYVPCLETDIISFVLPQLNFQPCKPPRYNWNIVESSFKHHTPPQPCRFHAPVLKCLHRNTTWQSSWLLVRGYTCGATRTHYLDSELASLCSYSLIQRAYRRPSSTKYMDWPDLSSNPRSTALEVSTLTITPSIQYLPWR
jgi:hypothetical protein